MSIGQKAIPDLRRPSIIGVGVRRKESRERKLKRRVSSSSSFFPQRPATKHKIFPKGLILILCLPLFFLLVVNMSKSSSLELGKKDSSPSALIDLAPTSTASFPSATVHATTRGSTPSAASSMDLSFPPLPIELKREIFRFCNQSTLAVTSQVSIAFLELSSPLFYRDVVVMGYDGLIRLFCESVSSLLLPFFRLQRHSTVQGGVELTHVRLPLPSSPPSSS